MRTLSDCIWYNDFIVIEDIKDFIKELKEFIKNNSSEGNNLLGLENEVVSKSELLFFIDKLAGEELTK